jgi:hypothetical protein
MGQAALVGFGVKKLKAWIKAWINDHKAEFVCGENLSSS